MIQYTYTIPSREDILGLLRTQDAAQATRTVHTINTIAKTFHVKPNEMEGLTRRLNAMERDGQIQQKPDGVYVVIDSPDFLLGRVVSHRDGFGFFLSDVGGDDVFLPEREMQKVLHGDRVKIRMTGTDRRGRPEGTIVEIVDRANTHVVGRLLNENGAWIVVPEDLRLGREILLAGGKGKAAAGQVVSVELVAQPTRTTQAVGKIVEVLGNIDDPGMEIDIAVRKYGVPHAFTDAAKKAADKLPGEVKSTDLKQRIDLRDIPMVTIDGEDARDFDDAVYCEPLKHGRTSAHRLIVAIADVSHYVQPDTALDEDALLRSTSVYFPRRVIPMLPEKLSNGLCSLNPAVDRLTLVCDAVISQKGVILAYQFYPAIIHSAARLTYTEVADVLANTQGPEAAKRLPLLPHLQHLYDVFLALSKARQARGAIDFETTETTIVCNASGKIEKILPRTRNKAHKLIEECMLAANVCAADLLERHKHPALYRVHATPTKEKLTILRAFLKQFGLSLSGGDTPASADYASLMQKIGPRPDAVLLQTMLLRSMQQAVYSPENVGHFGLSYECYAHFTSPIRRYPDLLTHRAIKAVLRGKRYEPHIANKEGLNTTLGTAARRQQAEASVKKPPKKDKDLATWEALGVHCSANERRADEASRDVEAWLKCYFMRDKLGEEFTGIISGVTTFGIFVQLDALYIEGLVHISELGADYFQYDETRHELRGERTGIRYQLTDRVTVQVSRVDLDARKIDLCLVNQPSMKALLKNEAHRTDTAHKGHKKSPTKSKKTLVNDAENSVKTLKTGRSAVKNKPKKVGKKVSSEKQTPTKKTKDVAQRKRR